MIRLFVSQELRAGAEIAADPQQIHYLSNVMRVRSGEDLLVFNGRDGEWLTRAVEISRRMARLEALRLFRPQTEGPDLDLLIALVKRVRLETIVEKAAELGVRRIRPIVTARANADHTNVARLSAIAVEASEQTGRLDVPRATPPVSLDEVLSTWPRNRRLVFCDEAGDAAPMLQALQGAEPGPWAILIGPEGGFSAEERAAVRGLESAVPVTLGPRILRADTAAIAALTLWQSALGDWRGA